MFRYNPDNKVMQTLSLYFDLVILTLLWVLTSLPVITIGVSATAMHRVLGKLVEGTCITNVAEEFFICWRKEWRHSTCIWILMLGILTLTGGDLLICIAYRPVGLAGMILWCGSFLALLLTLCLMVYIFPINACFQCTLRHTFMNAVRFTARDLIRTFAMIGIMLLAWVGMAFGGILSMFFVGPLLYLRAKLLSRSFAPVIEQYMAESPPVEVFYE